MDRRYEMRGTTPIPHAGVATVGLARRCYGRNRQLARRRNRWRSPSTASSTSTSATRPPTGRRTPSRVAPEGAPNVLIVLYDDTGLAAWSPYGGRIEMPTMQRLADEGLTYTQWHTTALCSPTRSCLLTGRNHHQNGYACIAEGGHRASPARTATSRWRTRSSPRCCARTATTRSGSARTTTCPSDDWAMGGSKADWPLARGFDRFYGFIGGETEPVVSRPRRGQPLRRPAVPARGRLPPVEGPRRQGDHASSRDSQAVDARQALVHEVLPRREPRTAPRPQEYIDKYKGTVRRRLRGVPRVGAPADDREGASCPRAPSSSPMNPMPEGTFSPLDMVRPVGLAQRRREDSCSRGWPRSSPGSRSTPTPRSGRIVDYLEESGQLDNTLIFYCADNGASGEGSPNGSVNENKFFNGWPDDLEENLAHARRARRTGAYNHYPTGWAMAFSTPFRMFKRYSYQGGICDPMVIHWPKGIKAKGEVRNQYHHVIDIVPTILECGRHRVPAVRAGLRADAAAGRVDELQLRRRRRPDDRRSRSTTRCSARAASGTRAGRRSRSTDRPRGIGRLRRRRVGAVPHRRGPRRGARPRRPAPREGRGARARCGSRRPASTTCCRSTTVSRWRSCSRSGRRRSTREGPYTLYPGTSELPEHAAPNIHGRSFSILAERRRHRCRRARA